MYYLLVDSIDTRVENKPYSSSGNDGCFQELFYALVVFDAVIINRVVVTN